MLFAHVEKEILNIIASDNLESNFSIQLAYSGGIDSSCLLDALYRLKSKIKFNLYLTYVNYNTSSYSLYVSEHIKTLPLDIIKRVESIKIDSDYNFESKAREAMENSGSDMDLVKAKTELAQAAAQLKLIKKLKGKR